MSDNVGKGMVLLCLCPLFLSLYGLVIGNTFLTFLGLFGTVVLGIIGLFIILTTPSESSGEVHTLLETGYPPPPELTPPPPKSPYQLKLEKADEMRSNPTPAEKRMWEILNSSVTPNFLEHIFYPQSVQYGYILDFYCPTLNLAIEVDGDSHNSRRGYDWERDTHLSRGGIQVLRASNDEVFNNPQALADSLCKIIQEKNQQLYRNTHNSAMRYNRGGYSPRRY